MICALKDDAEANALKQQRSLINLQGWGATSGPKPQQQPWIHRSRQDPPCERNSTPVGSTESLPKSTPMTLHITSRDDGNGDRSGGGSGGGTAFRVASLPHAGEIAPYPGGGPQSVIDAVNVLKAKRIGHGVLAYGNDDAMRCLLANPNANANGEPKVCLDVCPSSNYFLNVVPTMESHPLPKLLESGIPCTINSDDPLLFGCTLSGEYEICRDDLRMDDASLAACARYSFLYSCAPEEIKKKNIAGIERWLSSS